MCGKPPAFRCALCLLLARLRLARCGAAAPRLKLQLIGKAEPFRTSGGTAAVLMSNSRYLGEAAPHRARRSLAGVKERRAGKPYAFRTSGGRAAYVELT